MNAYRYTSPYRPLDIAALPREYADAIDWSATDTRPGFDPASVTAFTKRLPAHIVDQLELEELPAE